MGEETTGLFHTVSGGFFGDHSLDGILFSFQIFAPQIILRGFFCGVSLINDSVYLAMAADQARLGQGHTWTNPVVGAVIVKHHQVLARGYHHRFGEPHAEIDALNHLADLDQARGATIYVTLEPCSHYGKTPPCADRLIQVGIQRVVIGQLDPNPLVAGRGVAKLKAAGVQVTVLGTTSALNRAYNFFYQHHRPFVTVKYAMSIDGKLNAAGPQRTYLTSQAAYHDSQALRATQQAILIGEHTVQQDDPQLTVRTQTVDFAPWRIVLMQDADQLAETAAILQTPTPVYLLVRQPSQRQWPDFVHVVVQPEWTPQQILDWLSTQGIQSLLIEGGSQVQATWLASGAVDQLITYLAPLTLGGTGLPVAQGVPGTVQRSWELVQTQALQPDIKLTYRRSADYVYRNH